jgi:hypothetical protein
LAASPTGSAFKGHTSTATGVSSERRISARQQVKLGPDNSLSGLDVPAPGEHADKAKRHELWPSLENIVGEISSREKRSAECRRKGLTAAIAPFAYTPVTVLLAIASGATSMYREVVGR